MKCFHMPAMDGEKKGEHTAQFNIKAFLSFLAKSVVFIFMAGHKLTHEKN